MKTFRKNEIKSVNIKFDNGSWNPQTHNILLSYHPLSDVGFTIKIVSIEDQPITTFAEADEVLKKFKIK
jgi:hypothetical protein